VNSASALTESKLGYGAKIARESKLRGPEKCCFLGAKITTLGNLGDPKCN